MDDKDFEILTLKNALSKARSERDNAMFRRDVAEWAVIGIANANSKITIARNVDITTDLITVFGRTAGQEILNESGLAFKDHALVYELKAHIHYLENHARSSGLQFDSYKDQRLTALPDDIFRPSWGCSYNGFKDVKK